MCVRKASIYCPTAPHVTTALILALAVCVILPVSAIEGKAGRVARAIFTTQVDNREPVDQVLMIGNNIETLYFFTDLRHLEGQSIIHRWEYEGKVISSKRFEVKGARWRVYSSLNLQPHQTGRWTAVVVDDRGWPLSATIFEYLPRDELPLGPVILPVETE